VRGGRQLFPEQPARFRSDHVRPAPDLPMLVAAERPLVARALGPVPQNRLRSCGELIEQLARPFPCGPRTSVSGWLAAC
jgi:hypothetical protein